MMDQAAIFQKIILPEITVKQKETLIDFALSCCKRVSADYIRERLPIYKYVITASANGGLQAMQFIDAFRTDNNYYYLGPLYSRNNAFLNLFVTWLQQEWQAGQELYLAAEFEHPELFLFFKALFYKHSYPSIENETIPENIKSIVSAFAAGISHIIDFNSTNLSSRSYRSVYFHKPLHAVIEKWMQKRGIEPGKRNQLLLVHLPKTERDHVLQELQQLLKGKNGKQLLQQRILHIKQQINDNS